MSIDQMTKQENFSHAATVLAVKNVRKSIEFYTQKLGFQLSFSWSDPPTYAVLVRGGVSVHLTERDDDRVPSTSHCVLYIFVYDVDEIFQQCKKAGVNISNEPTDRDYKMKDFDIKDPDGHIISIGKGG